jgi:hypothetical protein
MKECMIVLYDQILKIINVKKSHKIFEKGGLLAEQEK